MVARQRNYKWLYLPDAFLTEWFDRVVTDKFEVAVKDTVNIGVSADISNLNTRVFTGVSDKAKGKTIYTVQ